MNFKNIYLYALLIWSEIKRKWTLCLASFVGFDMQVFIYVSTLFFTLHLETFHHENNWRILVYYPQFTGKVRCSKLMHLGSWLSSFQDRDTKSGKAISVLKPRVYFVVKFEKTDCCFIKSYESKQKEHAGLKLRYILLTDIVLSCQKRAVKVRF